MSKSLLSRDNEKCVEVLKPRVHVELYACVCLCVYMCRKAV